MMALKVVSVQAQVILVQVEPNAFTLIIVNIYIVLIGVILLSVMINTLD